MYGQQVYIGWVRLSSLKKNLNVSGLSEHPAVREENVKTFN